MSSHIRQRVAASPSLALIALGLAFALGLGLAPAADRAQGPAPAIGTRVVIRPGAALKVGDRVVDRGKAHHIYTVERVNGAWIWLISGTLSGWARAADVVPFNQAIDLYTAEIKRDPKAAWAFYNRGVIHSEHQHHDLAIADFDEATRLNPQFPLAFVMRGNSRLVKKEYDKAIADYSKAIDLNSEDTLARLNRGIARQASKDYDKAIADYDEAIRLGLKTAPVYNNRGHCRALKGNLDGALDDYTEAIRINPRYVLAFINRGNSRQSKGDDEGAVADYDEAIRIDPRSPWGYACLALLRATCPEAKFRDGKKAVELATHACELGGANNPYLDEVRAAAHAEAGEFDQAVEWQTRAIEGASGVPGANVEGDRERLKLYQGKKAFRKDRGAKVGT